MTPEPEEVGEAATTSPATAQPRRRSCSTGAQQWGLAMDWKGSTGVVVAFVAVDPTMPSPVECHAVALVVSVIVIVAAVVGCVGRSGFGRSGVVAAVLVSDVGRRGTRWRRSRGFASFRCAAVAPTATTRTVAEAMRPTSVADWK